MTSIAKLLRRMRCQCGHPDKRLRAALAAFSVSGPDADGIMWLHVDGGRGARALVNLSAMSGFARTAIVDACDNARAALRQEPG